MMKKEIRENVKILELKRMSVLQQILIDLHTELIVYNRTPEYNLALSDILNATKRLSNSVISQHIENKSDESEI